MGWVKTLTALFRADPPSARVLDDLQGMLQLAHRMFDRVTEPLLSADAETLSREAVRALDRDVNRLELEARRALVTAAAVNPGDRATERLRLMGLITHAERCGDFAKHIFDVFEHGGPLQPGKYREFLVEQRAFISRLFATADEVLGGREPDGVAALLAEAKVYSHKDRDIVYGLLRNADCEQAVAVALLVRFFKRIQRHVVNIISAVNDPGADLG